MIPLTFNTSFQISRVFATTFAQEMSLKAQKEKKMRNPYSTRQDRSPHVYAVAF